jgi:hypothetical protein
MAKNSVSIRQFVLAFCVLSLLSLLSCKDDTITPVSNDTNFSNNLVKKITNGKNYSMTFTYSANGVSEVLYDNWGDKSLYSFKYDSENRLAKVTLSQFATDYIFNYFENGYSVKYRYKPADTGDSTFFTVDQDGNISKREVYDLQSDKWVKSWEWARINNKESKFDLKRTNYNNNGDPSDIWFGSYNLTQHKGLWDNSNPARNFILRIDEDLYDIVVFDYLPEASTFKNTSSRFSYEFDQEDRATSCVKITDYQMDSDTTVFGLFY